jgi:3-methyladenine DNA glycosylase AlkD
VKLGDIRAVAKMIKTDHELALNLWDTGNVEAQLLATLIIKPKSLSAADVTS